MTTPRKAVFLDRDGTLLDELGYLARPEDLRMLAGVGPPLARLQAAGFFLCLITNQSGVARGFFDEAALERVHERLQQELARDNVRLDALLHCPHHPEEGVPPLRRTCTCRKPSPGLVLQAASAHALDLPASWMVGDSPRDLEAGRRAGVGGLILVLTGKGRETAAALTPEERAGVLVVPNLAGAAQAILAGPPAAARQQM